MSDQATNPVLKATMAHAVACRTGDPLQIALARRAITEAKLRRAIEAALATEHSIGSEARTEFAALLTGGA